MGGKQSKEVENHNLRDGLLSIHNALRRNFETAEENLGFYASHPNYRGRFMMCLGANMIM
jgi:hypothetical protein